MLRGLAVFLFTLAAAFQVVRDALVQDARVADRGLAIGLGARLWPSHPDVLASQVHAEVAQAAVRRSAPSAATLDGAALVARLAPLSPLPFLVQGAVAQRTNDYARAERLLLAARRRDPRSPAARYLLAESYLRTSRVHPALQEMVVLSRILRSAGAPLAPALADFLRRGGSAAEVRRMFGIYPDLMNALLSELAKDPANAPLILRLAERPAPGDPPQPWTGELINRMVEAGSHERAFETWSRLSGRKANPRRELFNPGFASDPAPPPFNWSLPTSAAGVVEPAPGGLRVLFFGRDDAIFASQLLLLEPGRYRLSLTATGKVEHPQQIRWQLTCLNSKENLLRLPVSASPAGAALEGSFEVRPACPAQRLELVGVAQEFSQAADFQISGLGLTRLGS